MLHNPSKDIQTTLQFTPFFFVQRYISAKDEDPLSSFYVKLLTGRQTDRRRLKHNLLGGGECEK